MDYRTSSIAQIIKRALCVMCAVFSVTTYYVVHAQSSVTDTVTITAIVASPTLLTPLNLLTPLTSPGGGGGGGGSGIPVPPIQPTYESAVFKGLAYPGSIVSLLKNGTIITEVPASPNGSFEITIRNLGEGVYTFGIVTEDSDRRKSTTQTFSIYLTKDVTTLVEGIFMPPTISTDKIETVRGEPIIVLGKAAPNTTVTLVVHSATELIKKVKANGSGSWLYKLDSYELELGEHEGKARFSTEDDISPYSTAINFTVGTKNVMRPAIGGSQKNKCDLNNDSRINLLDFSIMAFWYKRSGFPVKVDLNSDKQINLSDVSILAYCWTG
jgi:hypothetical protein